MEARSPVEIIGAILDEVGGLRQTNPRSYLPDALVREARMVFDSPVHSKPGESSATSALSDIQDLEGRTVSHVFDCDLKRGEALIACSDGAFLVLQSEPDGDGSYISTCSGYGHKGIADYLRPAGLVTMGLMTIEQCRAAEHEEVVKKARATAERLELQAKAARSALEKITAGAA